MNYERLLSYGNVFQLDIEIDSKKIQEDISRFNFAQYNPNTNINRYGLSVTSLDGELNGEDLDTLKFSDYDELSFKQLTEVYYSSSEIKKVVDPFKKFLGRTHFLNIKKGGYFPPHRDELSLSQKSFRVIVPIRHFNPPNNYFMYDRSLLQLQEGYAYFLNTNVEHCDFSFSDECLILVANIECCEDSIETVLKLCSRI